MSKKPWLIVLIVFIGLVVSTIFLAEWFCPGQWCQYFSGNGQLIVLAFTASTIFWYTSETRVMQKAIVRNTEIMIKPVLVLDFDFERKMISLQNWSNYPAYNVEFGEVKVQHAKEYEKKSFSQVRYKFKGIDVIPPKDKKKIQITTLPDVDKAPSLINFFTPFLPSEGEVFRFTVSVIYNDIDEQNWETTLGYSSKSGIISEMPKRADRKDLQKRRDYEKNPDNRKRTT